MLANSVKERTTSGDQTTKTSMTQYFDKSGTYKAYTTDGRHLFNEATEQIGSFVNGFLYDNQGRAIGHVKGKLILDKNGQPLYYTK